MKIINCYAIPGVTLLKTTVLTIIILLSACATTGENILDEARDYSAAASLRPIRFSRKNELRFWRLGWSVSGRVVTEEHMSFYNNLDRNTDRFLYFKKQRFQAPKDFASDLQKLSSLNGAHISCDSEVLDWPVYLVEGNWQQTHFTFFANIDLCTSESLEILRKYSGYEEMIKNLKSWQ
jgi:hypothetical protein